MIVFNSRKEEDSIVKLSGITKDSFVEELGIDASFFKDDLSLDRKSLYGQFTDTERSFLYNFVRKIKPNKVVEFSPCHGYTTSLIRSALLHENITPEYFSTYELDQRCYDNTVNNLKVQGFNDIKVFLGDVLEKMNLDELKNCDLLFVDSDHNREFVQEYVDAFFDHLTPGTWVGVHDVTFDPLNGETEVLLEWLKKKNITDVFFLPDVMSNLGVDDYSLNVLGGMNRETSSSLWFRI